MINFCSTYLAWYYQTPHFIGIKCYGRHGCLTYERLDTSVVIQIYLQRDEDNNIMHSDCDNRLSTVQCVALSMATLLVVIIKLEKKFTFFTTTKLTYSLVFFQLLRAPECKL